MGAFCFNSVIPFQKQLTPNLGPRIMSMLCAIQRASVHGTWKVTCIIRAGGGESPPPGRMRFRVLPDDCTGRDNQYSTNAEGLLLQTFGT